LLYPNRRSARGNGVANRQGRLALCETVSSDETYSAVIFLFFRHFLIFFTELAKKKENFYNFREKVIDKPLGAWYNKLLAQEMC
jgi:hypothetical protein